MGAEQSSIIAVLGYRLLIVLLGVGTYAATIRKTLVCEQMQYDLWRFLLCKGYRAIH